LNTEIVALGPDGPNAFKRYWQDEKMPFIGCADIKSTVASQYHQEVNWIKLGRMPALLIIDKMGKVRFKQYGENMADIPSDEDILKIIGELP
jgi:peroxiredoxin